METIKINSDTYTVNNIYYISPNGDDNNEGTFTCPFFSYKKAYNTCNDGDAICFLSGTHNFVDDDLILDTYSTTQNAIFVNKNLIIYSKSIVNTILNIEVSDKDRNALFCVLGENTIVTNLHIKYKSGGKSSCTEYQNIIFGDVKSSTEIRGLIKNCIIELTSEAPFSIIYDNCYAIQNVENCTFLNYSSWFNTVYSGKCILNKCLFNKKQPIDTELTYNNCLEDNSLTENTLYKKYTLNEEFVGVILQLSYLIKNNGDFYCISEEYYNTETQMYIPINIDEININSIVCDNLLSECEYLSNQRPIDKFTGDIQILHTSNLIQLQGIKCNQELVVANGDINKGVASTINSITLNTVKLNNGNLKLVLSIDNGNTWKTHDGISWIDLDITIPSTPYIAMTSDELEQWNNSKEIIELNGMTVETVNSLDYNTLTDSGLAPEYIRFAYVLKRPTYSDDIQTTSLDWDFNAKGNMDLMIPGLEYKISLYEKEVKFTSLIENDLVKVNFLV